MPTTTETVSREELHRAVRDCCREKGRKHLSAREYDAWARENGRPRAWRMFAAGGWTHVTRGARCAPAQVWRGEREDLLRYVRDVAALLGRGPFEAEYDELRKRVDRNAPVAASIVRRLGMHWADINAVALVGTDLAYDLRNRRPAERRSRAPRGERLRNSSTRRRRR